MRPDEREVAGLTCSAVMAALSDYVDGDVPPGLRERIEAHVAVCQQCALFGDGFARLIEAFRRELSAPPALPPVTAARLRAALRGPGTTSAGPDPSRG